MQLFVNIFSIVTCLLTLTLYSESHEVTLNDKFDGCNPPNCTITLQGGEHTVSSTVVVEGWDYFRLTATKQTIVRCVLNSSVEYTALRIKRTNSVVIENITFVNCSHPKSVFERYNATPVISIEEAVSVNMDSCHFPNYSQVGLQLNNTESVVLTNSDFKATEEHTYKRAVVYQVSFSKDVSFNANNLVLDGSNVSFPTEDKRDQAFISEEGVGGSLLLLIQNNGSVSVNISNSTIVNSNAIVGGGVFIQLRNSVTEYNVAVVGCLFENNTAIRSKIGKGGAMVIRSLSQKGNVFIKKCIFHNNSAISGGALGVLMYDRVANTYTRISHSIFTNNSAKMDSGGAIYAENLYISSNNHLKISNTQFALNHANSGGAIFTMNFYLDLDNSVSIHENLAYYGGGICLLGSRLSLSGRHITFERNNASHSGGALYVHSSSTVKAYGHETLIANNTAAIRGGGIFVFTKYFENRRHNGRNNWRDGGELFSFYCFLQARPKLENALILSNNKVSSDTKLCMGDDMFTNTWGPCYNRSISQRNPISRAIVFKDEAINKCSIALDIVQYNPMTNLTSPCQLMIGKEIKLTGDCNDTLQLNNLPEYYERLKQAIRSQNVIKFEGFKKVHLFFPGYESRIDIQSLDGMKNPIQTITQIIFKPNNIDLLEITDPYYVLAISLSRNTKFVIKKLSDDFTFGQICLQSYSTLNKVSHCEDAIIGDCPSPLLSAEEGQSCRFKPIPKFDGHDINTNTYKGHLENKKYSIQMNPGTLFTYPANKSEEFVFMHCTWFQCKCHISASVDQCVFDVNAPEKQCHDELKFPYCTECRDNNKRICPPFNWFCMKQNEKCFHCQPPYIMIVVYVIMTLIITVIICLLHIDVFSDYLRSLAFYSSTLYVLCINCGTFMKRSIYKTVSIPIAILNLLVTHMFPFCLPTKEPIYLAIFDMIAPFMFVAYIGIIIVLVSKAPYIKRLGRFNVVHKLWTIIILTYIHLCNQAFNVLNCPINSLNERTWLFDGNMRCLVGLHLVASIIAILLLFGLGTFPIMMIIFSRSKNPDYQQFVGVYEERYKPKYKHWELFKLYLRVLFPFVVTLLPQGIKIPLLPCSFVSIFCLLVLVLNSLLKPATNDLANKYESLCFIILAYIGLQNESFHFGKELVNVIVLLPYILYATHIVIKLYYWLGKWIEEKKTARERGNLTQVPLEK